MNIKKHQSRIHVTIAAIVILLLNSTNAFAIQCVDYIKQNYTQYSGMTGNANTWWGQAKTQQHTPSVGSVLVFPGPSSAGHVAYVAAIVNATEIRINHANWNRNGAVDGTISTNVRVQDASGGNWTKVKMEFGNKGALGATAYATYGFILPNPAPTKVTVNCPSARLNVSQTSVCSATVYYSNNTNKSVTSSPSTSWVTNNPSAIVSSQGVVTAKGATSDTAVIVTASYKEGTVTKQGTANLTVVGLDGKLPAAFGCTDPQVVASKAITGGSINLLYSKKCGTNWARASSTNSTVATIAKITRVADNKSFPVSGKGTISTPMVYSPNAKACASGKIGSVSVADNIVCK